MNYPSLRSLIPFAGWREPAPVVAVLRMAGVVGQVGPMRRGLSLAGLAGPIERAFGLRHLKAVALSVNSPGGSPVQTSLIAGRIRALAEEKGVPVVAFVEDIAASGGYWLACAADEIYADAASVIGSIGVISAGFGFQDMIRRVGIERRVHASGARKGMLDPFSRERPEDVEHLEALQHSVHQDFIEMVRARRGDRLRAPEDEMFSGAFWSGRAALEMGLIDGIGDLRGIMRERFGERVKLRPVIPEKGWLRRRVGLAGATGGEAAAWPEAVLSAIEERMAWGRFGL
ncbi:MAG: S49 family peptidase [Rhodospirillales bacterium]|jgi:signal peptide peptidase SppA|nr:S49 family peptidase [Rhodospirillales bacterium]